MIRQAWRIARFVASAVRHRNAYVDLDGCLLQRFAVPYSVKGPDARLAYWMDNLPPTPVVKHRLYMLYCLKLLGVKLHIWTNRSPCHHRVTLIALGDHMRLFDTVNLLAGNKQDMPRKGPCIDDQAKYIGSRYNDVCVPTK